VTVFLALAGMAFAAAPALCREYLHRHTRDVVSSKSTDGKTMMFKIAGTGRTFVNHLQGTCPDPENSTAMVWMSHSGDTQGL